MSKPQRLSERAQHKQSNPIMGSAEPEQRSVYEQFFHQIGLRVATADTRVTLRVPRVGDRERVPEQEPGKADRESRDHV